MARRSSRSSPPTPVQERRQQIVHLLAAALGRSRVAVEIPSTESAKPERNPLELSCETRLSVVSG